MFTLAMALFGDCRKARGRDSIAKEPCRPWHERTAVGQDFLLRPLRVVSGLSTHGRQPTMTDVRITPHFSFGRYSSFAAIDWHTLVTQSSVVRLWQSPSRLRTSRPPSKRTPRFQPLQERTRRHVGALLATGLLSLVATIHTLSLALDGHPDRPTKVRRQDCRVDIRQPIPNFPTARSRRQKPSGFRLPHRPTGARHRSMSRRPLYLRALR